MTDIPNHFNSHEKETFVHPGRAEVSVQWRGTDLCCDIQCGCGTYSHVDGYCFGQWKCRGCLKVYRLPWSQLAYEIEDDGYTDTTNNEDEDEPAPRTIGWLGVRPMTLRERLSERLARMGLI